ncbi:unnamed protein product [Chrysodeixis includens]|uniref:Arrestin C-terminal-like domain-containing protein n=1 Tax=Chrysodeixis includens TaxID=689277 RepID=A0A9P0BMP2_CHRIL|nr:unnamed protein product [Chrysodeixis includens]
MGITCQLLLSNNGFSIYKPGQPVIGTVHYHFDKPLELLSATISLVGNGKCSWETSSGDSTSYYDGKEEYTSQHIDILQTKTHDKISVQPGSHEFPFQFLLPEDTPSSHLDPESEIKYRIIVKFIESGFVKSTKEFSTTIQVYSDVKPCPPESLIVGLKKEFLFSFKNKFVYIKGIIEKTFVNAGEDVILTVSINKETDIPIKGIQTELVNLMTYTASCKTTHREPYPVNGSVREYPGITARGETTFRYIIPTFPHLFSILNSKIIAKEFKAKVTVKFPNPHINASIELPVVIHMVNTEPKINESSTNEPPSYKQVMDEVEEKYFNDGEKKYDHFKPHSSKSLK